MNELRIHSEIQFIYRFKFNSIAVVHIFVTHCINHICIDSCLYNPSTFWNIFWYKMKLFQLTEQARPPAGCLEVPNKRLKKRWLEFFIISKYLKIRAIKNWQVTNVSSFKPLCFVSCGWLLVLDHITCSFDTIKKLPPDKCHCLERGHHTQQLGLLCGVRCSFHKYRIKWKYESR